MYDGVMKRNDASLNERLQRAAQVLKTLGAQDVFMFGSVARGRMHEGADVDLAVTGLPPERFFAAMGQASRILDRDLDLIDLDEPTPFTRYLKEEGELVRVG